MRGEINCFLFFWWLITTAKQRKILYSICISIGLLHLHVYVD